MKSFFEKIYDFMHYRNDEENIPVKRFRDSDDDPPTMKKYRTVPNHFPKVMPKEEEWRIPERFGTSAPREHYVPIMLERDLPGTSKSSVQSQETRDLLKPLEKIDFGKHLSQPSTSSQWHRSSSIFDKTADDDLFRTSRISTLSRDKPSLFKSSYERGLPSLENKFFKTSTPRLPLSQNRPKQNDPYEYSTSALPKESYKYFKSSNKSNNKKLSSDDIEIIELSDSDDHVCYLVKEPKRPSEPLYNIEDSDDDEYEEEMRKPCKTCKGSSSQSSLRRSMSPHLRDNKISRFKVPLSTSKERRLNSFTPFWKSKRSIANSSAKPIGRLKFLKNTRAIAERCFRLDDKKKYEELIKLSAGSFFKRSNPNASSIASFVDTQKRIQDLTSSLKKTSSFDLEPSDLDANLQNGTTEKITTQDGAVIVLSDNEIDQPLSPDGSSTSSSVRIDPINTLKQSFKSKSVSSPSWMDELDKKYRSIKLDKKQEAEDRLLISTNRSKSNREYWLKAKSLNLESLHIDLTVEAEVPKEIPLPELTNEQQNIIQHALRPNPPQQVLIQKFNIDITRRDINTLAGLNWLNDEVINFYMNLIMERSQENKNLPRVHAMNTFFYPKLMQSGQAGIRRWTRKVDVFSYHIIVAPIHLGVHWCMSIIDLRKKTIKYYDSMGGKNMNCCDALLKYLEDESMDKKQTKFDTTGWTKECVKDIPQQMNGSDCGMFSCTFAEFISRDAPITFSQNEMPYLRRKMVLEIVQGKLLM